MPCCCMHDRPPEAAVRIDVCRTGRPMERLPSNTSTARDARPDRHERRAQEKARLKDMALEFFARAGEGIAVVLVDPASGSSASGSFRIDRCFSRGFFRQRGSVDHGFPLRDLGEVCQGEALRRVLPHLESPALCVLVRTTWGAERFLCRFPTAQEASRFQQSMTILRLSVASAAGIVE
mmetsp:Transcript_41725/g.118146  ORF Transcript_41725/g.118146 Transcript_41725/m.118146 type:complete len:179 (+) Transcript_41725:71-607(+)|eukprot:CAMPEP_0176206614 /NCGR_PEP_ID=MMETSP0121_2-20121125/12198_1 /TAXON_ID=160619 /ORGANISM="Kryptoperidinium foliaceum, Strain CCMP 1326" /LENGTH=178 /DNA_ID=CAMNT_0017545579 /DNA_START=159 /DNA_END=695 /DNA_ORIENTATION=+